MRNSVIALALLFSICSATMIPHIGPAVGKSVKIYDVDIDAPLRKQWEPILKDFKEPF